MGSVGDPKPERILKTDLHQYGKRRDTTGPYADNLDLDVLIIGAGFGGAYSLHECRKQGFKTVLYDAGQGFGGTWRWVCTMLPCSMSSANDHRMYTQVPGSTGNMKLGSSTSATSD